MSVFNTAIVHHTDGTITRFQFQGKRAARVELISRKIFSLPFNDVESIAVQHRQSRDASLPLLTYSKRYGSTFGGKPFRF